jgi:hypothetical protein
MVDKKRPSMRRFIYHNGLSITFFILFLFTWAGQFFAGFSTYNSNRLEDGQLPVSCSQYFYSGHFIQATFENWESEFLQMALFVLFTIWLRQKGSSESKGFEGPEEVDREPDPNRKGAPWPVRRGGWVLAIYKHSLSIALIMLFVLSFVGHLYGSLKDENDALIRKGLPLKPVGQYVADARFWFESFQNWQSELLSVFAMVVLSVFLRQKGSSQSKPVDAPNDQTGD